MRALLIPATVLVLLFESCRGPCTLKACVGTVELKLVDSAGNTVRGARGTVTVMGGAPETVDCLGSSDGLCTNDGLRLNRATGPIEVDLQAGALSFKGSVMPTFSTVTLEDFNGPGCDCSVQNGVATVTLR
ncbi:MAG: hypothetical protein GQE15_06405 [Archangiaceae bacterium]|nr:hypothetical protein [Archangiaceae bacterium]